MNALAAEYGATLHPLIEGPASQFRNRARLAIRGRKGRLKIGLFREGTHEVIDIPHCPIHHAAINRVCKVFKQVAGELHLTPYSDTAHRGLLRYLQAVVSLESDQVQLVVVTNTDAPETCAPWLDTLADALGPQLHSLWCNGHPHRSNAILGSRWYHHSGPETLVEHIGDVRVHFPPGAFGQANLALAQALYHHARSWIPPNEPVLELYAGVGSLGLSLTQRGPIVFNELSSDSLQGLQRGLAELETGGEQARVLTGRADAPKVLSALKEAGCVIADPPRKGFDPKLLQAICQSPRPRLIYVSCGLDAFERDARALCEAGYSFEELVPYALFPFTEHVEILARFEHRSS